MIRPPSHIPPHDFDRLSGPEYIEAMELQQAFDTDPDNARLDRLNILLGKATDPARIKSVRPNYHPVRRDRVGGADSPEHRGMRDRSGPFLLLHRDNFQTGV